MKSKKKTLSAAFVLAGLVVAMLWMVAARYDGSRPKSSAVFSPASQAEAQTTDAAAEQSPDTPTEPTPEPTPEPELPQHWLVTVDGTELKSESVTRDELLLCQLDEIAEALKLDVTEEGDRISFTWRRKDVRLSVDATGIQYGNKSGELACAPFRFHGSVAIPIESFCDFLEISLYYDEEFEHLYCTPGAGNWELPEGYSVPVLMYHGVNDYAWTMPSLFVTPAALEEQIQYLLDNGWEPIWFEDLEHVDQYEKPIMLTFDDGYLCNHDILLPILEKYQVKATCFIITDFLDHGNEYRNREEYLTWDMVREMDESGLISIQSHTANHLNLTELAPSTQEREFLEAERDIVRQIGKEPFVLSYPEGGQTQASCDLVNEIYRFAVKMTGPIYVTGEDPTMIYRIFIERGMGMERFERRINGDVWA